MARALGAALALLLALSVALPVAVVAQGGGRNEKEVQRLWQLLEYVDVGGTAQAVPPGFGATLQMFSGSAWGEAPCSTFETTYDLQGGLALVFDPPTITRFDCDPVAQALDDAFYEALAETATFDLGVSILTLQNAIEEPLMTLTRAVIPQDPTIARWGLARLGMVDGSIQPVNPASSPWMEFLRGGRVVGSTGCGSFIGSWERRISTIEIKDVDYRLEECTDPLRQQAEGIIATFDEVTDFEVLPAGLTLEDSAGTTRMAMTPGIELANRTWTPVEILDDRGRPLSDPRLELSAVRFANKVVDGRSVCSGFKGKNLRSGLALSTDGIDFVGTPCSAPKRATDVASNKDIENAFMTALDRTASHALRGSQMELLDVECRPVMRLVPQRELVGPVWQVTRLNITPNGAKAKLRPPRGDLPMTATFEDIGIILGDTGSGNTYSAFYETPGASQIEVEDAAAEGRDCKGRRARTPVCKQEQLLLDLLQRADSFVPREDDLRLLEGPRALIHFSPADVIAAEQE